MGGQIRFSAYGWDNQYKSSSSRCLFTFEGGLSDRQPSAEGTTGAAPRPWASGPHPAKDFIVWWPLTAAHYGIVGDQFFSRRKSVLRCVLRMCADSDLSPGTKE